MQDLLVVAAEVQRMVEIGGFRSIPVQTVASKLSKTSHMILMLHNVGLIEALEMHPKSVRVTMHEGQQVVSWYGVTWLGPGSPPPQRTPEPAPTMAPEPANQQRPCPMLRGKATENVKQLAGTVELQEAIRDMASCLLAAPDKTLLVSELGCKILPGTRALLKTSKVRAAQLLQAFSEDFQLQGSGPGTAAKYLHDDVQRCFRPQPHVRELNNQRYCRLLKLAADVSECYGGHGVAAREVLSNPDSFILVDCRTLAERAVSVLPNSVPVAELTDRSLDGNRAVVAYCAIGCRAARWCREVTTGGLLAHRLHYLVGGVAAWAHCGGQLVDLQTRTMTQRVHCWAPELAAFFPLPRSGYEAVTGTLPEDGQWLEPLPEDALSMASGIRFSRLRSLAWEVRLRYWPSVFCVEAQDVLSTMRSGDFSSFVLVDCRTPKERDVSMIDGEGLIVMTSEEFNVRASEILMDTRLTVVSYCTVGGRSGIWNKRFIETAVQDGRWRGPPEALSKKVLNLLGGVAGWLHSGGKLVCGGRPTPSLHPWCHAFLDLFPLAGLRMEFDEAQPDPADALCFAACKSGAEDSNAGVPQKLLQLCSILPREVISDSLTRAMRSVLAYED